MTNTEYVQKSNIRIAFIKNNTDDVYFNLYGFLSDQGLSLDLTNDFGNSLDLAGSLFGMLQEGIVGLKAGFQGITQKSPQEVNTKISNLVKTAIVNWGEILPGGAGNLISKGLQGMMKGVKQMGTATRGYVDSGIGDGGNLYLNAPYYWRGTQPISFGLTLYQIADAETDILYSYQRVLEILSPDIGGNAGTGYGQSTEIVGLASGPGTVEVHYFPVDGSFKPNGQGTGTIIFGPCLCSSVKMEIKSPYSDKYMPIIGEYNFQFKTARILDRSLIHQLFRSSGRPLLPNKPDGTSWGKS